MKPFYPRSHENPKEGWDFFDLVIIVPKQDGDWFL
jgi:hypothetical protein